MSDVRQVDEVWCLDLTTDDDDGKRLKTVSSKRLVPIHDVLLEHGLLDYVEEQKRARAERMFPDLSYDPKNGYGRNVGRWFNESLLVKLGMKKPTLPLSITDNVKQRCKVRASETQR